MDWLARCRVGRSLVLRPAIPIRPERRFFYPINWAQLSAVIRFGQAKGAVMAADGRTGGWSTTSAMAAGGMRKPAAGAMGWGRRIQIAAETDILGHVRRTRIVLAAAHRDHDTSNNADANFAAFCQRCHMIHDRPEHQRRRWRTLFRRKALGDLFCGPYA